MKLIKITSFISFVWLCLWCSSLAITPDEEVSVVSAPFFINLHNKTNTDFVLVFSELNDTIFNSPPDSLAAYTSTSIQIHTSSSPSGIIRFYQGLRPSFSLIFIGNNAYTSYCKDKPRAFQSGMFCKVNYEDRHIDLSIFQDGLEDHHAQKPS